MPPGDRPLNQLQPTVDSPQPRSPRQTMAE